MLHLAERAVEDGEIGGEIAEGGDGAGGGQAEGGEAGGGEGAHAPEYHTGRVVCRGGAGYLSAMQPASRLQLPVLDAPLYETLLERAGALIYVVDRRERLIGTNQNFRLRIDADVTHVATLSELLALIYPDPTFRDMVLLTHQRILSGAARREVEWVLTTRLSEQRQIRWQFVLVEGPTPSSDRRLLAVGEDVTDRRKLEQWVRLQNALLTRVPEGIVVADMNGRILHWTGGAESILGYAPRAAMERPLEKMIAEKMGAENTGGVPGEKLPEGEGADGARTVAAWVEELQSRGEAEWRVALRRESGDSVECEVRGSRVMNERAQMVGIALMIALPLTSAGPARAADTAGEDHRLERLIGQTSSVALVVTDGAGTVRTWGRGAERLGGVGATRAVGKVLFNEVMRVEGFSWESLSSRIAARGRFQTRVMVERGSNDRSGGVTRVPAELDALALRQGDTLQAVVCFFTDRTEMHMLAEESLQTKLRALPGVFVDGVVRRLQDTCTYFEPDHRFVLARLSDLRSLARMVRQGSTIRDIDAFVRHSRLLELDKEMDETMYRLGEGAHRLRALVEDVGRFEAGEVDPPGPLRLVRELEAARDLVAYSFDQHVSLEISIDDLPAARASRAPLLRAFCLLLLAAAEGCMTREDAKVVIDGRYEAGWIHMEIRDNGRGFGVDVQSRLNDLAYLAAQPGHAPLFLGLAREALRNAGGSMEVNTAAGSGSRIRVSFPSAESTPNPAPEPPVRFGRSRGRVLLIEDDDLLRRALERHIHETHDVSAFGSVAEALAGSGWEAAVISFPRPDGIGLRLIQRLCDAEPALRQNSIVVVPPGLKYATREKLVAAGVILLTRPVDFSTLRSLLLRLLPGEELITTEDM